MRRTFVICYEPMRLLPPSQKDQWTRYWNSDYIGALATVVLLMRMRELEIDRLHKRYESNTITTESLSKGLAVIEHHVDLEVEKVIGPVLLNDSTHDEVIAIGDAMQKLMPAGELEAVELAFFHRRGMWFTGVVK